MSFWWEQNLSELMADMRLLFINSQNTIKIMKKSNIMWHVKQMEMGPWTRIKPQEQKSSQSESLYTIARSVSEFIFRKSLGLHRPYITT